MAKLDRDLTLLIHEKICKPLQCKKLNRCCKVYNRAKREVSIAIHTYVEARPDSGLARIVKDESLNSSML